MKVRVNLFFPGDHPVVQIPKKERAAFLHDIISDWYKREERIKHIEESLARIEALLQGGVPTMPKATKEDKDHERMKDQLMMDILNLGKRR